MINTNPLESSSTEDLINEMKRRCVAGIVSIACVTDDTLTTAIWGQSDILFDHIGPEIGSNLMSGTASAIDSIIQTN